jgi:para-nitrobenzyl esterase
MIWVYGGGFEFGSSADPSTDGAWLAALGVAVVSFNSRVGVLGFLAHPELDSEGPPGNYGLQDQLAALRWVQANASQFGGDPGRVTVFGESAGAHAIGLLMASPLAVGLLWLLYRAIGQSGAFWDSAQGPRESSEEAHARGLAYAARLGASSLSALREWPAEQLNGAAGWDFSTHPGHTAFSPHIDHFVVPGVPAARFLNGEQLPVPLLAGWNAAVFRPLALLHATALEFRQAAGQMFGADRLGEFLTLYPADTDAQAAASAEALIGDLSISEQTWQWLELQHRAGQASVYGYIFTYTSPYVPIASHLVDVPFVFGTLTPQFLVGAAPHPAAEDRALSNRMMAYWVNFAASADPSSADPSSADPSSADPSSADPNGAGLPHCPVYGESGTMLRLWQVVQAQASPQAARFRFLAGFRQDGVLPARWHQRF